MSESYQVPTAAGPPDERQPLWEMMRCAYDASPMAPIGADRARRQPETGEVQELVEWLRELGAKRGGVFDVSTFCANLTRAADLLERLSPPQPVSVAERLPGPGDCDEEGRCWWGRAESDDWSADWTFATYESIAEFCEFTPRTVWLPFRALPLPTSGEGA